MTTSRPYVNLTARLRQGRQLQRLAYKQMEKDKLGNLRAGNSGIMDEQGQVAGSCVRVTHLRQLGIEVESPEDNKLIMFQMGTANEDVIYKDLKETSAEDEIILREEEIPIEWLTSNGTKVTGRPDMVICRRDTDVVSSSAATVIDTDAGTIIKTALPVAFEQRTVPVWGIEIKSIASVWTTREVLFDGTPKLEHLIQAAHYSWKLDVPFKLLYKQYANQAIPSWAQKMFPKKGQANSEHIEYNDKGDVKNINPFEIAYDLEIDAGTGRLKYRREGTAVYTETLVTVQDIDRYYEFVSTMQADKKLGGRPLAIGPTGSKKSYSKCEYCPLQDTCDAMEDAGYDRWLAEVRLKLPGGK